MSIPFWRAVDYSDDGCYIYECLNCYRGWEARTNPKYSEWSFCPCCGCKWEGQKEWDQNEKYDKCRNPSENARLCMPSFQVQERFITLDPTIIDKKSEWRNKSSYVTDSFGAVFDLLYYIQQELNDDLVFGYNEYRIVRAEGVEHKLLKWDERKTGEQMVVNYKKYKFFKKEFQKKIDNYLENKVECLSNI